MTHRALNFRKADSVAFIEIGSAQHRLLSPQLASDLVDLCSEISWDEEVRVVVIEYDGEIAPSFDKDEGSLEVDPTSVVEAVAGLKQPVLAAIRGDALGFGLELAMACDIRVATHGARFGLPQILGGAIPHAGGTQRLPRLIGLAKALEMVLTGNLIDASEATRIGLVHRIMASVELKDRVKDLGREMAEKSPLAMSYVKEALLKGVDLTLDQGLRMELDLYLLLFTTEDRIEGVTAFQEKRKPEFKGE